MNNLQSLEVKPLDTAEEIEDLIVAINGLNRNIDFYKSLKKRRVETLDSEIKKNESRIDKLKDIIKLTLEQTGHKSLKFPGIGKVSSRVKKGNWVIEDEESLIRYFKDNLDGGDFDQSIKTTTKIVKSQANKILDSLEKTGDLPDSVKKEDDDVTLSISFDEGIQVPDFTDDDESESNNTQASNTDISDMDDIGF